MSVSNEHDHSSLLPYLPPNVIAPDTGSNQLYNQNNSKVFLKFFLVPFDWQLPLDEYHVGIYTKLKLSAILSVPDSDLIEGPSRISLNCPIRYVVISLELHNSFR